MSRITLSCLYDSVPSKLSDYVQNLQIQPPGTETPLSLMTIRALEVRAAGFDLWRDIPASTAFIGDDRELVVFGDLSYKKCIVVDGR